MRQTCKKKHAAAPSAHTFQLTCGNWRQEKCEQIRHRFPDGRALLVPLVSSRPARFKGFGWTTIGSGCVSGDVWRVRNSQQRIAITQLLRLASSQRCAPALPYFNSSRTAPVLTSAALRRMRRGCICGFVPPESDTCSRRLAFARVRWDAVKVVLGSPHLFASSFPFEQNKLFFLFTAPGGSTMTCVRACVRNRCVRDKTLKTRNKISYNWWSSCQTAAAGTFATSKTSKEQESLMCYLESTVHLLL